MVRVDGIGVGRGLGDGRKCLYLSPAPGGFHPRLSCGPTVGENPGDGWVRKAPGVPMQPEGPGVPPGQASRAAALCVAEARAAHTLGDFQLRGCVQTCWRREKGAHSDLKPPGPWPRWVGLQMRIFAV